MTPQLQQAIKLLQMSNLELASFVVEEIERNPLLETDQADTPAKPEAQAPSQPEPKAETVDSRVTAEGDLTLSAETFDTGTENLHSDSAADADQNGAGWHQVSRGSGAPYEGGEADFDRFSEVLTLRAHLLAQIGQTRADPPVRLAAQLLAEELDEAGFYRGDLAEFAARIGVPLALATQALSLVQTCEPTGVGARSLEECLALQLAEQNRLDPAMVTLLSHLKLVAAAKFPELCRRCGVDREDLADMLAELRALDPRPGAAFVQERAETLVPDVYLRRAKWGGWQLELNTDTLPRVLVNNRYAAELEAGGGPARTFVAECRNSANWLVKSLEQRAQTILKVSTEIVRHQDRFFAEGITGLRPLTLKMVAEAAG
ncbi:MAG: RNA polymerase sigma-54 factor, partial [Pseudomonadota bacterium]